MNNEQSTTKLADFSVGDYKGGPAFKVLVWSLFNYYIFDSALPIPYTIKRFLLLLFCAKVGAGLVIKPKVRIKYPWRLTVGDFCWIGESVWIDNLEDVYIGNNVSISQGAMLLTGNHDYTKSDFPYRLGKIIIEDGAWIGAKSVVCPGITCASHSILTVNSVASKNLDSWSIYAGNPAVFIRMRVMDK